MTTEAPEQQTSTITYTPIGKTEPRELELDINGVRGTDAIEAEKHFGIPFDAWVSRIEGEGAFTEDVLFLVYLLRRRQHEDGCAGAPCRGCLEPDITFEEAADVPLTSLASAADGDEDPKDSSSGSADRPPEQEPAAPTPAG